MYYFVHRRDIPSFPVELCILAIETIETRYVTLRIYTTCTIHTYREIDEKKTNTIHRR
jgi:hypothetical protein